MPSITKDRNLNAGNAQTIFSIPVDYHLITSVSLYDLGDNRFMDHILVELGLFMGKNSAHTRLTIFASGLMGGRYNLGWTGRFPTEPGMSVYCIAYGPDLTNVRLAVTLWKIVMVEGERFVLDP